MTAPNRTYQQVGQNGYAQATEMYATDNIRGPGAPATFVDGDPNGTVSGSMGQLAIDRATGNVWQNTDGALTWVLFAAGGGGGATVLTSGFVEGDGTTGDEVRLRAIEKLTIMGNNQEPPGTGPVMELTPAQVGAMLNGATAVSGMFLNRQVLTASGVYVPTQGTKSVVLTLQAGGGGGGSVLAGAQYGEGGGAGVTWQKRIVAAGAVIVGGPVTIGGGGSGAVSGGAAATAGGDTSCEIDGVTYTAKGGAAGASNRNGPFSTTTAGGSTGASTAGADWVVTSSSGPGGTSGGTQALSGRGGSTPFGTAGGYVAGNSAGVASSGYGAGGGGAVVSGGAGANGSDGRPGVVFVDEYA